MSDAIAATVADLMGMIRRFGNGSRWCEGHARASEAIEAEKAYGADAEASLIDIQAALHTALISAYVAQSPISPHIAESTGEAPTELREFLGKLVRAEWVAWAREQPNPKPSWLAAWEQLTEPEREVDRRIGERIWSFGYCRDAAPGPKVRGPLTVAETNEALMTTTFGASPTEGPAIETVPWPKVTSYSGGGSPEGFGGRVWIQLGDGPEVTEYVRAPTEEPSAPPKQYVSGPILDCEACMTEDACRIRGQCAHYLREVDREQEAARAAAAGQGAGAAEPEWQGETDRNMADAAPPAAAPGEVELPPLPEPIYKSAHIFTRGPAYSTDQLIRFGRACIAAAKGKP